jgi:hypothetical protein
VNGRKPTFDRTLKKSQLLDNIYLTTAVNAPHTRFGRMDVTRNFAVKHVVQYARCGNIINMEIKLRP